MGQRLTYWAFLGVIGLSVFFMLYSSISFNANAPVQNSKSTIEQQTAELAGKLGFSMDSLQVMTQRTQHLNYYQVLKDSSEGKLPSAGELNRRGVNLTGWKVSIGRAQSEEESFTPETRDFMSDLGRLDIRYDQQGNVRRISSYPQNENPTFVAGDSLFAISSRVVEDILGYNLSHYKLNFVDVRDTLITAEPGFDNQPLNISDQRGDNSMVFNWTQDNTSITGPDEISLKVEQIIRENGANIEYGVAIEEFKALDKYEPEQLNTSSITNLDMVTTFGSLAILAILVFFLGIKFINKGQVEWRKAIFTLVSVALGALLWRIFFLANLRAEFWNQTSEVLFILNNVIFAAALGLYAAMAYIGWEAMARSQDQKQIKLWDAFWRRQFFFRETGESLLRGYALGGVMLGIFAVGLYLVGTEYYQYDSQYGFTEASMQPKLLTINLAVLVNVWLVALGHVGITTGFLQSKINNRWLFYGVGIILIGFLLSGSASLFEVIGSEWFEIIIYTVMAAVVIYAFDVSGLLTFTAGWWVFSAILMVMPYWGSTSLDVAYVAWAQFFIIGLPLIYGFITFRYGRSLSEIDGYIPEYQERMANHLRVEKEIEIARESQFKLMPLKPPAVEGVDVYGFFMPSFEVGGDYFDYIVSTNGSAEKQVLNMTIADVSGKAMKAAMQAVFTSGLLLSRLHRDVPEAILREITPTIHSRTDRQTFITCIIAQYDPEQKRLRLANAGHCLPILKRNGKAEFIKTPAPRYPLGVQNSVSYQSLEVQLQPGDFLLMYSDGLPEAVNPEGERFGFDTLISLVESLDTDSRPSNEISIDIKRRIQKFSDYQLADDTTIISLKV